MECKVHTVSVKSPLHQNNEDRCFIGEDYIVIADGMGGERDGDIASRMAVEAIRATMSAGLPRAVSESGIKDMSLSAIRNADAKIRDYIDSNPESDGMGTTVLLAVEKDDSLYISWCGDSHCYACRGGRLKSVTKDHSYVQELIDAGLITEQESFTHPDNNLITRYVGGGKSGCVPDFVRYDMSGSDIVILCSDGLSGYCRLQEIETLIKDNPEPKSLPDRLLELAVTHGSNDDITIAVMSKDTDWLRSGGSLCHWFRRMMQN